MPDPIVADAPVADTAAAAPVAAPVVETPAPAPAAEVPAAIETPAAAPASTDGMLLGGPEADQQAAPAVEPTAGAEAQPEAPANLPTYDAYAIPEALTVTNPERFAERMSAFDAKVATIEQKYGIDHEAAAAFRQEVLSMGMEEIANALNGAAQASEQAKADAKKEFADQRTEKLQSWKNSFETEFPDRDKRTGALTAAESVIREFAGGKASEAAFRQALVETGMANHPAMIRLLSNVAASMEEGKPIPAQAPGGTPSTKAGRMYR